MFHWKKRWSCGVTGWRSFSMRANRKTMPRATLAMRSTCPVFASKRISPKLLPFLSPTSRIVVYCDGTQCDLSHRVSERLQQLGFANVQILTNGWSVWRQAGLPISNRQRSCYRTLVNDSLELAHSYRFGSDVRRLLAFSRSSILRGSLPLVANYRLLPLELINIFAILLPWIELVAGMCVLLGIWLRPAALVLTVTTGIFILAVASALARGLNVECGCFGKIGGGKVGLQNLAINIILFTLAALTVRTRDPAEHDPKTSHLRYRLKQAYPERRQRQTRSGRQRREARTSDSQENACGRRVLCTKHCGLFYPITNCSLKVNNTIFFLVPAKSLKHWR